MLNSNNRNGHLQKKGANKIEKQQEIQKENKEKKVLKPTNDFVFKKIFGSVGSERITTSLLEAILKINITAIDLDKNPITEKDVLNDKMGIMDIRVEINNKIDADIEMQIIDQGNIEIRLMRYVSKIFIRGLKAGENYLDAKESIAILIANFEIEKHKNVKKILTEYEMREKNYGNIVLTDKIKVYILELPKIERIKSKDESLNLWIKFMKDLEVKKMVDKEDKELEETIQAIQEAEKKYEELCQDEHARYIAELREKYIEDSISIKQLGYENGRKDGKKEGKKQGLAEGMKKGKEEGVQEGRKQELERIAKNMKNKNYSIEEIIQITQLTKKEIENL